MSVAYPFQATSQLGMNETDGDDMRPPRLRFTIGGLMILVLVVSLGLWARRVVLSRMTPSLTEQQAQANYKQALLTREIAEFAISEYENGVAAQSRAAIPRQVTEEQISGSLLSLKNDVAKARSEENSKFNLYQSERVKRLTSLGF